MHDDQRDGSRKAGSKPLERRYSVAVFAEMKAENGSNDDARESAEEVAEDESSWLG